MTLGPLRFGSAVGGTADWIYPGPTIDLQSPASAQAVDGTTYLIYAEAFDRSQWEISTGAYTAASKTFARTTILANSLGTTAKINFGNPPLVSVLDNGADLAAIESAWTAYTPVVTAQSGAFTTVSASGRFKAIDKTVLVSMVITITSVGTGTYPVASLPSTAASNEILMGRENAVTGKMLQGLVSAGAASATIFNYDNTAPSGNGFVLIISGVYESV